MEGELSFRSPLERTSFWQKNFLGRKIWTERKIDAALADPGSNETAERSAFASDSFFCPEIFLPKSSFEACSNPEPTEFRSRDLLALRGTSIPVLHIHPSVNRNEEPKCRVWTSRVLWQKNFWAEKFEPNGRSMQHWPIRVQMKPPNDPRSPPIHFSALKSFCQNLPSRHSRTWSQQNSVPGTYSH